jgi:hypothetical protein
MPKGNRPYVVHYCRNKKCNAAWLAPDKTCVTSRPPQSDYCIDCEVFGGFRKVVDPERSARAKALNEALRAKRNEYKCLEGL